MRGYAGCPFCAGRGTYLTTHNDDPNGPEHERVCVTTPITWLPPEQAEAIEEIFRRGHQGGVPVPAAHPVGGGQEVTPEQELLKRLGIETCPECGRAVQADPQPASGWIAKCGRRIAVLKEVDGRQCPKQAE